MNNAPRLRARLAVSLIALLSACGPKQSPQTRQYLQQVAGAVDEMNRELSQETLPTPPSIPKLSKDSAADADAIKSLIRELAAYYTEAEKTTASALAICNQAQSKVAGLDTTGVDSLAVDLGGSYSGLSDQRQQLAVNLQAFLSSQRMELENGNLWRYAPKLVADGVATLSAPTNGGGANAFEPTAEDVSEMDAQAVSVQRAIAQWRSEAAAVTASRRDLLAALKAKYPGEDWSFLAEK